MALAHSTAQFDIDLDHEARRFLEFSQDLVCIAGTEDGYFKYLNAQWVEILGFSIPELLSKPFIEFVHPEDRADTLRKARALSRGARTINFHNRYITSSGEYCHLQWAAMADQKRKLTYAAARDVTEAKRTARALGEFAHVVSHDLKAPLRGITQLAGFLARDYGEVLGPDGRQMVELLRERARRMNELIDGVLEHSRVGRTSEARVPVDVGRLLLEIQDSLAPPAHIEIRLESEFPVLVTQRTHVRQLFQNLIANAIKYMDKARGVVDITCEAVDDGWHFCVADNGPGIEARYFERIFEMFETVADEGTGVGLAVVKKIVDLYDGRVWIESTPGEGSRFHFVLPRMDPRPDDRVPAGVSGAPDP